MSPPLPRLVVANGGLRAHLDKVPQPGRDATIRLDDGRECTVPASDLIEQADGSFALKNWPDQLTRRGSSSGESEQVVAKIPIVEESATIEKRERETGKVVVHVTADEHVQPVDVPLVEQQVEVRRVAVNRLVDGPVPTRQEGDTMIVPVMEEVLVVEKKLMLREEVHVTRRRVTTNEHREVVLRREQARVLRTESQDQPPAG